MSIRARILALMGGFAVMALIITGLGLLTLSDYSRMMRDYGQAYENSWRCERLNHLISNVVMESRGMYLSHSAQEAGQFSDSLNKNLGDMESLLAQWKAEGTDSTQQERRIDAEMVSFIALRRQVATLGTAGKVAEAQQLGLSNRTARIAFQRDIDAMVNDARNDLEKAKLKADRYGAERAQAFLMTSLGGIALMMGLCLIILRQFISGPLRAIAEALIKTSKGDYTIVLPEREGKDEMSAVWRAVAVLKQRAIEAERLAAAQREADRLKDMESRQILLD